MIIVVMIIIITMILSTDHNWLFKVVSVWEFEEKLKLGRLLHFCLTSPAN